MSSRLPTPSSRDKLRSLGNVFRRSTDQSSVKSSQSLSSSTSNLFEGSILTPLTLEGYKPTSKHRLLDISLAEDLRQHLPPRLQISHDWTLLYSIEQNGISLNTLYNSMLPKTNTTESRKYGYLIVIRDQDHQIFGCYINEFLKPMDKKRYYGNGECFLWKTEVSHIPSLDSKDKTVSDSKQLRLKVFHYTSLNDFIIYSNQKFISIGSGEGKFGLWIDNDLYKGASEQVDTFGNEPLSSKPQFKILGLEVWKIG